MCIKFTGINFYIENNVFTFGAYIDKNQFITQFIMKKTLLSLMLICAFGSTQAQNIYSFGFDGTTANMLTTWERTNQSVSPSATALWTIPTYTAVVVNGTVTPANAFGDQVYTNGQTSPVPNGQAGGGNSFALVNYASTTSTSGTAGTISNWLISPSITVENGDVVSFYTRKGTSGTQDYADRLEMRMSSDPFTINPSTGSADVGSFTTVGVTVNPNLVGGFVYPKVWTKYSYTVSGLTSATPVKFAFRYFVTAGGVNGANSDIIGIDTFSVDRAVASTSDFFAQNIAMYPNPANGIVTLASKNATAINSVQVTDLNGRIVKSFEANGVSETKINVSDLTAGMYFVSVKTDAGSGSMKLMKD